MNNDKLMDEYLQWSKDTGRFKHELTDVIVNDNGVIKTEKKMACVVNTSPDDWREFCMDRDMEYEGKMKLLAIY